MVPTLLQVCTFLCQFKNEKEFRIADEEKTLRYYRKLSFFFSASSDTTARLWSMASGKELKVYQGHHKATTCCALHDGADSLC